MFDEVVLPLVVVIACDAAQMLTNLLLATKSLCSFSRKCFLYSEHAQTPASTNIAEILAIAIIADEDILLTIGSHFEVDRLKE